MLQWITTEIMRNDNFFTDNQNLWRKSRFHELGIQWMPRLFFLICTLVESHIRPQKMWGQRSSRVQWPLFQFFAKTVTVSTYLMHVQARLVVPEPLVTYLNISIFNLICSYLQELKECCSQVFVDSEPEVCLPEVSPWILQIKRPPAFFFFFLSDSPSCGYDRSVRQVLDRSAWWCANHSVLCIFSVTHQILVTLRFLCLNKRKVSLVTICAVI